LSELHTWGYLVYKPSFSPISGSLVEMIPLGQDMAISQEPELMIKADLDFSGSEVYQAELVVIQLSDRIIQSKNNHHEVVDKLISEIPGMIETIKQDKQESLLVGLDFNEDESAFYLYKVKTGLNMHDENLQSGAIRVEYAGIIPMQNQHSYLCKIDIATCAPMQNQHRYLCKIDIATSAILQSIIKHNINNIYKYREREKTLAPELQKIEMDESEKNDPGGKNNQGKEKRKKVAAKKEKRFSVPTLEMVIAFFLESEYSEREARKFYFHFEANGWRVAGKTGMKNWQAAAHKWMMNEIHFKSESFKTQIKPDSNKKYDEPL
jgi:hypothetical protein